jgi:drug/metabolite transporter (DMT)-like permease
MPPVADSGAGFAQFVLAEQTQIPPSGDLVQHRADNQACCFILRTHLRSAMVFLVGVAAALSLGLGYVLQQRVAARAPLSELLSFRLLVDLTRKPLWWAGIGAMIIGELLAGLALRLATVALVEPLLSTNLLFALGFAALVSHQRIHWHEIGGAVLLSASLGVFIAVGNPHSSPAPAPNDVVITLAVCAVVTAVAVLVAVGEGLRLPAQSVLLATGAGLLYGLQDASTRAALVVADHHGISSMFVDPWLYIVIGSAVVGILLSQSAFRAARLDYSLPPIAAAEPIAGIALGVGLLGDVVSVSVVGLAVEAACLVGMVAGVALIARSSSLAGHHLAHLFHPPRRREVSPAPGERADSP